MFLTFCTLHVVMAQNEHFNRYDEKNRAQGRFYYYYDRANGIVHSTGRYKNGIPVGRWKTYHPDGSKYIITRHYKNRAREIRFYPNAGLPDRQGKLEKRGWSKLILDDPNSIRYYWHGKWKLYDEDGKLFRILLFSEGRVIDVVKDLNPAKESIMKE